MCLNLAGILTFTKRLSELDGLDSKGGNYSRSNTKCTSQERRVMPLGGLVVKADGCGGK